MRCNHSQETEKTFIQTFYTKPLYFYLFLMAMLQHFWLVPI